jgi:hypothetical protein
MVAFKVSLYLGVSYLTNLSPGEGTLVPKGNNLTPAGQWKTNGPPQRRKRSLASATLRIQQPLVPCTRATNYYVSSKPKDIPATSRGLQRQHGRCPCPFLSPNHQQFSWTQKKPSSIDNLWTWQGDSGP